MSFKTCASIIHKTLLWSFLIPKKLMLAFDYILYLRKVFDKYFVEYISATAALYLKEYLFLERQLSVFLSKSLASLMRNYFPKRTLGAPLHTLSKLYDVSVGFVFPLF